MPVARRKRNIPGFGWLTRKETTYHRDVAGERKRLKREALEERKERLTLAKLRAQEKTARARDLAAEAKIKAAERKIATAEHKVAVAEKKMDKGGMAEAAFEAMRARMEREIQAQEEHKRAAMARLSNPRGTRSSIRRAGQHGPNQESAQTSTEYRLGYNLGQTDRQTAALHRTARELLAAFEGNFGIETLASSDAFEAGYNAGYGLAGSGAGERDAGGQRGGNPQEKTYTKHFKSKEKAEKAAAKAREIFSDVYIVPGGGWWTVFGRSPKPAGRTNPCTAPPRGHRGLSRKNPDEIQGDGSPEYEQAKRTAELFHGRPVKEQIEVTEQIKTHDWYVSIGPLINLKVKPLSHEPRKTVSLPFPKKGEALVQLWCSPDGRQFYLRGGDQELNLEALGMGEGTEWFRDHMLIGEAKEITYRDAKKFHRFDLVDYYHQLGEVTKKRPMLAYDSLAHKLSIVGGQYKVEMEDLVDGMSPGIVN